MPPAIDCNLEGEVPAKTYVSNHTHMTLVEMRIKFAIPAIVRMRCLRPIERVLCPLEGNRLKFFYVFGKGWEYPPGKEHPLLVARASGVHLAPGSSLDVCLISLVYRFGVVREEPELDRDEKAWVTYALNTRPWDINKLLPVSSPPFGDNTELLSVPIAFAEGVFTDNIRAGIAGAACHAIMVQRTLSSEQSVGFSQGFETRTKALKEKYPQIDLAGLRPKDFWGGPEEEPKTPRPEPIDEPVLEDSPTEPDTSSLVLTTANAKPPQAVESDKVNTVAQSFDQGDA
ncbi:hypothetical protein CJ030_MR6G018853 [Morella rubra]|uniref:Uncharacterized protein n=1 Tax=Morella rubra TaxID=262757 RepID=A0A6A1VEG1_9ROSI|nr:hypothetical protein CJ030_MR6G018849 [Morella rubra]KAB1209474.1 hypothetical protein CJ030_MR6G018853 [Morella rubra]